MEKHFNKLLIFSALEFIAIIILAITAIRKKPQVYYCKVKHFDDL